MSLQRVCFQSSNHASLLRQNRPSCGILNFHELTSSDAEDLVHVSMVLLGRAFTFMGISHSEFLPQDA